MSRTLQHDPALDEREQLDPDPAVSRIRRDVPRSLLREQYDAPPVVDPDDAYLVAGLRAPRAASC